MGYSNYGPKPINHMSPNFNHPIESEQDEPWEESERERQMQRNIPASSSRGKSELGTKKPETSRVISSVGEVSKSPTKGPFLSFTLSTTPCRWWLSFSCTVSSTITSNPTRSTAHSPHLYPPISPPRPLIIQLPAADGDRTAVEGPGKWQRVKTRQKVEEGCDWLVWDWVCDMGSFNDVHVTCWQTRAFAIPSRGFIIVGTTYILD